jgi:hypothetical protein
MDLNLASTDFELFDTAPRFTQDRAALDGPLQQRRRKGRVDDERHPARPAHRRDRVEIGHTQERIGDRLHVHHPRGRLDGGVDRGGRRLAHQRVPDAESL